MALNVLITKPKTRFDAVTNTMAFYIEPTDLVNVLAPIEEGQEIRKDETERIMDRLYELEQKLTDKIF